ncbi:hypothetical protein FACS1894219_09650 [Clostridia bacterium]|nr:hypothetical protein FACS1894219_09650 [Clostridia bacterium]
MHKKIISVALALSALFSCVLSAPVFAASKAGFTDYKSFRDVPGVTAEEIAAVDAYRGVVPFFTYGMTESTELYRNNDTGSYNGFADLFCNFLSEFFEIKFKAISYEWNELISNFRDREIAFSGEISTEFKNDPGYYLTDSIADRKIIMVSLEGQLKLQTYTSERPLILGFLDGTSTETLIATSIHFDYETVTVKNYSDAYRRMKLGEIDAILIDETAKSYFERSSNVIIEDFLPITYNTVSMATMDPNLAPFISIMQKYIASAGSYKFTEFYTEGYNDYLRLNLNVLFTADEVAYITEHSTTNTAVSTFAESDNYPVTFYNRSAKEWQGIAVDVLSMISELTDMQFTFSDYALNNDHPSKDGAITGGYASLLAECVKSPSREGKYIFSNKGYQTDYYTLISEVNFRNITLSDVPYIKVGLIEGSVYKETFDQLFPTHGATTIYASRIEAIEALEKHEVDVVMANRNLLLNIINYLEKTGFKANLILHRPYDSPFGASQDDVILMSIINKTMDFIDSEKAVSDWTRRVFDYSSSLAQAQRPFLIGAVVLAFVVLILLLLLLTRSRAISLKLERAVKERTKELEERSKELEIQTDNAKVASQAKGEFLARMSHEIRTPLNAVMGMTEIARRAANIEKKDSSLNEIAAASSHLLGILNDVLDMSKIESGKFVLASETFDLFTAMTEVQNIIMRRCDDKRIDFRVTLKDIGEKPVDGMLSGVIGDKLRLKQVLINLLGNAVKFTPEDGFIAFTVEGVGLKDNNILTVKFSVTDSGIGMTEDQMKNLFTAFEQADSTIAVRFGGTGLGLAISQNLVTAMGGKIVASSVYGEGSTFEFYLDMMQSDMVSESVIGSEDELDLTGKRMLIVEDIDINRVILAELLSDTHIEIEEAADGLEAVEAFSIVPEFHYDIVLMDIQMPNMNGYDATEKIRALDRADAKKTPILAMTANAYREDIEKALAIGMNGHLSKPVNIADVLKALRKYVK